MRIRDIPVPEVYKESSDFRFFLKWFDYALTRVQYDNVNMADLYDPLRCPKDLLWMLGDTMGYQYDSRLCTAFNRFAMLFFMSLIKYKGSKTGVTLAAEVNLKQFDINAYGEEKEILYNRLEDTSIPVNSVYVNPNVDEGYIDVVYFSSEKPIDSCIEYVRPLGMYCFQYAGVRVDTATKISVDARLANASDATGTIGPTRVGHYTRDDYARMQKMTNESRMAINLNDTREKAFARSSMAEAYPTVDAGYRALSSLQLANNSHIVKSLINMHDTITDVDNPIASDSETYKEPAPIFALGITDVDIEVPDDIRMSNPKYNLLYDKTTEEQITPAVYTADRIDDNNRPIPMVNEEILDKDGNPIPTENN